MEHTVVSALKFNAWFGDNHAVKDVSIQIEKNQCVAVMGPSGCGKTTFLRCINRMHELIPGTSTKGSLKLYDDDVYTMNPIYVRYKIGMVFQRPNPFPNLSIYDNVIAGIKVTVK